MPLVFAPSPVKQQIDTFELKKARDSNCRSLRFSFPHECESGDLNDHPCPGNGEKYRTGTFCLQQPSSMEVRPDYFSPQTARWELPIDK